MFAHFSHYFWKNKCWTPFFLTQTRAVGADTPVPVQLPCYGALTQRLAPRASSPHRGLRARGSAGASRPSTLALGLDLDSLAHGTPQVVAEGAP